MEVGFLQETKSILKSLVLSSPNGMTLQRLNRDYREMVGNWIPYQKLGYPNLELFLRSIPDTLVIAGHGLQARIGFVASDKVNHINEMVSKQKNTTRERKSAVIQSIQPIVAPCFQRSQYYPPNNKQQTSNTVYCGFRKDCSNPVNGNSNVRKYHRNTNLKQQEACGSKTSERFAEHKKPLPTTPIDCKANKSEHYKEENNAQKCLSQRTHAANIFNGEQNALHRNISLDKPVHKEQVSYVRNKEECRSADRIVFPTKVALEKKKTSMVDRAYEIEQMENEFNKINPFSYNNTIDNDDDIEEAVPEFAANGVVFRVDFPEHTVGFGQKIPKLNLPQDIVKGAVIGVFISEIHSPFKFWFHIYKENHELDILMNRIECFYSRLSINELVIPKNCLSPGHVCAALYNDMWHRAEVLNNVCNNKVKVHFFDYGTVTEIEIENIKYLPEIFSHTPMQAIRGSLSHIKPVSSLWPKSAVRAFLSMVSEILLYAQIMEIDEKDQTVYMVLCDTNGIETVQINKQMVDKGYAKLDSEWDDNKVAKNGYRKRHPRDIFPTFEMLETGEYPSLSELENLLAQGIDYEALTEKIILFNENYNNDFVVRKNYPNNTLSFDLLDTNPFKSDIISEITSLKIFGD